MSAVSVVVLTMGDRGAELETAVRSARRQHGVEVEIVLVVNGGDPDRSIADVVVEPGENLGIPGGRNAGAAAAAHDLIAFLDDDGWYEGDEVLRGAVDILGAEEKVAVVGLRIVDETGATAPRHQPTLRGAAMGRHDATSFPGGACVVRQRAVDQVGGLCDAFFYGLEETDLSWRLLDADWTVRYASDLVLRHPRTDPSRHRVFHSHTARNRVWLAHRTLPAPLAVLYLVDWLIITTARNLTDLGALRAYLSGTSLGMKSTIGPRRPMAWRTVLRMARLGRPPII